MIGRPSPSASAREAKLWRRSFSWTMVGARSRAAFLLNVGRNAAGDTLRRLMDRVARQMGVARRGLDVAVAEQLAE